MLAHLLEASIRSVALLLIAAAALWILRTKRTAALQHAIWTAVICGMLALLFLGSALPRLSLRVLPSPAIPVQTTQTFRVPAPVVFEESLPLPTALPAQPQKLPINWSEIVLYAYATIAFAFLARFATGMLLVRRLIGKSTLLDAFRESASIAVPLTVGWIRPTILLPLEWRQWDPEKLNAVLQHEGAHARRRDGLAAAIAGVNRCLFWFHPLAWWLERKLGLLAELACDEACVAAIGDRERYARLLLDMAQVVDRSHGRLRQHALTMAAGSHIRRRVDSILEEGRTFSRGLSWTGRTAIALCGISTVLCAGAVSVEREMPAPLLLPLGWPPFAAPPPPPPTPGLLAQAGPTATRPTINTARPKFEVASIRPAAPTPPAQLPAIGGGPTGMLPPPPPLPGGGTACIRHFVLDAARVDLGCVSLQDLLLTDVLAIHRSKLMGPGWMNDQRFDISAKLPQGASADQLPAMFQTLLEERFGLTFHREDKEQAVYALVVSKGGLKLEPAAPESAQPAWVSAAAAVKGPYANGNIGGIPFRSIPVPNSDGAEVRVWQSPNMGLVRRSNTGGIRGIVHYEATSITLEGLANLAVIAGNGLDSPVLDMTGLGGRYQVNLDISMADLMAFLTSPGPKDPAAVLEAQVRMLQEAFKNLGLQLDSRKARVETIVIDHLERTPTAN